MINTFISRIAALAFFGAASMAIVPAAKADMVFHNVTDRPLHFEISCGGSGTDEWTVSPHGMRSLYCNNGAQVAEVRILTDHDTYETVVRDTVWDGAVYNIGYDGEGDVNLRRV